MRESPAPRTHNIDAFNLNMFSNSVYPITVMRFSWHLAPLSYIGMGRWQILPLHKALFLSWNETPGAKKQYMNIKQVCSVFCPSLLSFPGKSGLCFHLPSAKNLDSFHFFCKFSLSSMNKVVMFQKSYTHLKSLAYLSFQAPIFQVSILLNILEKGIFLR